MMYNFGNKEVDLDKVSNFTLLNILVVSVVLKGEVKTKKGEKVTFDYMPVFVETLKRLEVDHGF